MSALLNTHTKYSNLVKESFAGDSGFMTALDKVCPSCLHFCNYYTICYFGRLVADLSMSMLLQLPVIVHQSLLNFWPGTVMLF